MSDTVWIALLTALPPTLVALAGLVVAFRGLTKVEQVQRNVEVVHKATNSMKDDLVAEVRKAAFAQGVKEGKEEGL